MRDDMTPPGAVRSASDSDGLPARRGWDPLLAAILATLPIAVLIGLGAKGGDMPAQLYRSELARHGVWLWDNHWYSGLYLPSYSILYPPLAGLVGDLLLVGMGGVVASALFTDLVLRTWGASARWGGYAFALLAFGPLCTGQYAYSLGITALLGTLCCLSRGRRAWAVGCAALTVAFAPLAFAFLVLILAGHLVVAGRPGRETVALATAIVGIGALGATVVLALPARGDLPFTTRALWPALAVLGTVALACLTAPLHRTRRLGVVCLSWLAACLILYLVTSPIGHNVTRIQYVLFPLALAALAGGLSDDLLKGGRLRGGRLRVGRRHLHAGAAVLALGASFVWTIQPYAEVVPGSLRSSFAPAERWKPVNDFLAAHWTPDYRVEVATTYGHWESYWVGRSYPLARGWFRQADTERNGVLYHPLTAAKYQRWLRDNGVRHVVLPPGDIEGHHEGALLRSGTSGLVQVGAEDGFTMWELPRPTPLLTGPGARVTRYGHDVVEGRLPARGSYLLRLRFNRHWVVGPGVCLSPGPGGWTLLRASSATTFALRQPTPLGLWRHRTDCQTP